MGRKRKNIDKKLTKLVTGHCKLCGETNYNLLDVHRIGFEKEVNKYETQNTVVLCANCHRRVHSGEIVIDRWYSTTKGRLLRVIDKGQERLL